MAQGTQGSSDDGLLAYSSLLRSFKKIPELIGSCSKCSRCLAVSASPNLTVARTGTYSKGQSPTTCFSNNGTRRIATPFDAERKCARSRRNKSDFVATFLALANLRYLESSPLRRILRIFGTTYRLTKQVRLALADSEYCARKTASQNQERLVAKKAKKRTVRPYTKTEEKELRAHSKAKTPVARISKLTKRSVAALRKKAGEMGLPLGHRR